MQTVYPDYYKDFRCIASECKHNCCIGWEIDIDPDTAAFYKNVPDELGDRIRDSISCNGEPHFILGENERCPHLNEHNLCNIIRELGEEHLCAICRDHPRFRCELPGRVEIGLGLCCEAAGRLILGKKTPSDFRFIGDPECEDGIIKLRDMMISILQNREKSIPDRISDMLTYMETSLPDYSIKEWSDILLDLERLDEKWTDLLCKLKTTTADHTGFENHMAQRQTEYEQFLVYLIYRHFANAPDKDEAAARAAFAALGYTLLYNLGAVIFTQNGTFDFEAQVELARLFSSELEYSEDNLYILLDELY